jgi:hypothetical protein
MTEATLETTLTPEEQARYFHWVGMVAKECGAQNEILDEVTVSFTFTPLGIAVVAHTVSVPKTGHSIVLRDL